ncbi:MTH [Lepeophtheirus salmonis]|uniref:MTH n=1 Tax=Lepeophtheirus salmonis TaxID=72036 RepID=A0A7R8CRH2_LEPSM|nr:MTH [Lepeophtheirus salmonis]CAF2868262.1 MTH [Lepeophtheirus salmonis]
MRNLCPLLLLQLLFQTVSSNQDIRPRKCCLENEVFDLSLRNCTVIEESKSEAYYNALYITLGDFDYNIQTTDDFNFSETNYIQSSVCPDTQLYINPVDDESANNEWFLMPDGVADSLEDAFMVMFWYIAFHGKKLALKKSVFPQYSSDEDSNDMHFIILDSHGNRVNSSQIEFRLNNLYWDFNTLQTGILTIPNTGYIGSKTCAEKIGHKGFVSYSRYVWTMFLVVYESKKALWDPHSLNRSYFLFFFATDLAKLLYFHLINFIVIIANVAFFTGSSWNLLCGVWADGADDPLIRKQNRLRHKAVFKLFFAMGISWLAEVISWIIEWTVGKSSSAVIIGSAFFDIVNALQGKFFKKYSHSSEHNTNLSTGASMSTFGSKRKMNRKETPPTREEGLEMRKEDLGSGVASSS